MIPQMTAYIDIGVNLTGGSFRHDREDVVQRAVDAGVTRMIVTGTDLDHSRAALDLTRRFPAVLLSTAGVHPHHASEFDGDTKTQLGEICAEDSVVAVGECGLDYNRNYSSPEQQRFAFEKQLQLAVDLQLPVFLHQRDAYYDFVGMLREYRSGLVGAVAHCFTGSADEAQEFVEMGMYIGVTGWICDERRGQALQQAVRTVPLDRIMLETDAPYLLPRDLGQEPVQKRRNEPCYLPHICRVTAGYMGIDHRQLAQSALANTRRFFAI